MPKSWRTTGCIPWGDIARCSLGRPGEVYNEELLYRLFGVNAELLIDHAWGWEPCTIADIKAYRPQSSSVGSGQILPCPYTADKARLVVREMAESLVLSLVDKGLVTSQLVLTVGYDRENLTDPARRSAYRGQVASDRYGRPVPKHAHGTANLPRASSSTRREAAAACQLDLFTDYAAEQRREEAERQAEDREKHIQHAMLDIQKKYGKNAILKGMDLQEGATAQERNNTIGGHKA